MQLPGVFMKQSPPFCRLQQVHSPWRPPVRGTQVPFRQQSGAAHGGLHAPGEHCPFTHVNPALHITHITPLAPQAAVVVPGWQAPF